MADCCPPVEKPACCAPQESSACCDGTKPGLLERLHIDGAWLTVALLLAGLAIYEPAAWTDVAQKALSSFLHTLPFILAAVSLVAYLKATGAERLLARAFEGPQARMIVMAALLGGLSPFCSCEVIPFVAAMLALGAPLGAVMAFWLASPLMDPAMFLITSGTLGWDFAVGKTVSAISIGILGGSLTALFARSALFADPLKQGGLAAEQGCGCGTPTDPNARPIWRFWQHSDRLAAFRTSFWDNLKFLGKWLALAYLVEALMLRYLPAELVAGWLGGDGLGPILMGAIVGGPAYLNGYAAVPLVAALLEQGMSNGAAMSFMIAGGVSCIPAAIAVWALVKPRVFAAYIGFAFVGATLAGIAWGLYA